jgi:hypothetical protein
MPHADDNLMITYTEKGIDLHDAIERAGYTLAEWSDGWRATRKDDGSSGADVDAAVQSIIDGYTLSDAVRPVVAKVKALAYAKIIAFLPEWKQSNCNARLNELNEARFSRPLTESEQAEVEAMRALWNRAKAIRAASDVHEANLAALATFAAVQQYDITSNWPGL